MINKYYLYKKILTYNPAIADLKQANELEYEAFCDVFGDSFGLPRPILMDTYRARTARISDWIDLWIQEIDNLTGKEAYQLFKQKKEIVDKLSSSYAEIFIGNYERENTNFKDVLEDILRIKLSHIENYEKAEKLLTGKRTVTVIVDGNRHDIKKDGRKVIVSAEIDNNIVSMEKCHEITEKVRSFGHEPKSLDFLLSIYTKTEGNDCGDIPEECLLNRHVHYDIKHNCMTIYDNREPVYQNNNGVICTDFTALMDS
jgi:hypothetical protein